MAGKDIDNMSCEELRSELSSLSAVLEKAPTLIYIYDLIQHRNIYANKELFNFMGYSAEEVQSMGDKLFEITLHPDDMPKVMDNLNKLMQAGPEDIYELEYRMKRKDGQWRWLYSRESVYEFDKDKKPISKIGTAIDITDRKHIELEAIMNSQVLDAMNEIFLKAVQSGTEEELVLNCLNICQSITGSKFGFMGEVNPNGRFDTIALNDPGWKECQMAESQASKLIHNMEIRGLWGKVIKDGASMITNKPMQHESSVGVPDGHPPLVTFLGVPLKIGDKTIGMIALGNKEGGYEEKDKVAVERLSVAIVESLRKIRADITIQRQTGEILEVSTPTIKIWDGIIAMPLIGSLDSARTQMFMERLLNSIIDSNSEIALIDITGVPTVDTQTAHHLIDSITAAKLLGARVILTGVKPLIAQTLVQLGIDLSDFMTQSTLEGGLKIAYQMLGMAVTTNDSQHKQGELS